MEKWPCWNCGERSCLVRTKDTVVRGTLPSAPRSRLLPLMQRVTISRVRSSVRHHLLGHPTLLRQCLHRCESRVPPATRNGARRSATQAGQIRACGGGDEVSGRPGGSGGDWRDGRRADRLPQVCRRVVVGAGGEEVRVGTVSEGEAGVGRRAARVQFVSRGFATARKLPLRFRHSHRS